MLMISKVLAANYDLFGEMLVASYLGSLQKLLESHKTQDIECALSCLFIAFKQKKVQRYLEIVDT